MFCLAPSPRFLLLNFSHLCICTEDRNNYLIEVIKLTGSHHGLIEDVSFLFISSKLLRKRRRKQILAENFIFAVNIRANFHLLILWIWSILLQCSREQGRAFHHLSVFFWINWWVNNGVLQEFVILCANLVQSFHVFYINYDINFIVTIVKELDNCEGCEVALAPPPRGP